MVVINLCRVEGCETEVLNQKRKLCAKHYAKWYRRGSPLAGREIGKHGMCGTKEYMIWASMKSRCYNSNCYDYKYYGGRGRRVCTRWLGEMGFLNFLMDMGKIPRGLTLERINNTGDYTPKNCRLATRKEQARNTRRNVVHTMEVLNRVRQMGADGIPYSVISEKLGIGEGTVGSIVRGETWV